MKVLPTPGPEEDRNILFLASLEDKNFSTNRLEAMGIIDLDIETRFLSANKIDIDDAVLLTDDLPALNILNKDANKSWRKGFIESYILDYSKKGIPLFY